LNLLFELVELLDRTRIGELCQLLEIDHADLRRLGRLFELREQPVDRFELLLDVDRLWHGERRSAGELVFAGQLVDLILVAQSGNQLQ